MNRLILIGNGFDLAHGLRTSYSDFILDYWSGVNSIPYKDDFYSITDIHSISSRDLYDCKSLHDILQKLQLRSNQPNWPHQYVNSNNSAVITAVNKFFNRINYLHTDTSWVDIEVEYFNAIKETLPKQGHFFNRTNASDALEVNRGIREVIKLFNKYLSKNVKPHIINVKSKEFEEFFNDMQMNKRCEVNRILNFNYTNTIDNYIGGIDNSKAFPIHGIIDDHNNSINMGFGDERDKMYSELESYNNRELIRYTKSAFYANHKYYEELMVYLNSDSFVVDVVGHSCGLSDRTLLSTIFEHEKCRQVFVHYYKYSKPDEFDEYDNYSDTYRNITRHFDDKGKMRSKVLNRSYSMQIPQLSSIKK